MLKAIAIDDEPVALEIIGKLSGNVGFLELKGCFTNAFKAMDYLATNEADLIFLDIKMPDISGLELARSLARPPMIIFTTAYSEHAVQSFELDAIDYLLKPFSQARFLKACHKAHEQVQLRKGSAPAMSAISSVFIKSGYEQIRVGLEEILYAESNGNYMHFVLAGRKIVSRLTMAEVEELLPGTYFIRVHRSFIISKNKITKIDRNTIWIGPVEIPVGVSYLPEMEKILR